MSNSVSRFYPKDNQDTSLREETFCPCPPETSPLDEVGGGIPARHMLLNETVSGGLSITGDFLLSDLDELFKEFIPTHCSVCSSPTSSYVLSRNGGSCHYCFNQYWENKQ